MLRFRLPVIVTLPRVTMKDRRIHLNINNYHNWHYRTYQALKQAFKEEVRLNMMDYGFCPPAPLRLTYTLYHYSKGKVDVANVLSIVDKFASDALVELGVIPGDDKEVVQEIVYRWGGVDKERPRAELVVEAI